MFAPVLVGGKTLSTAAYTYGTNGRPPFDGATGSPDGARLDVSASALALEPWAEVTARQLGSGHVPLWNPHQGAGAPLAANMQSAVFDPLLLAVNLHPTPRTWDLTLIGSFLLGSWATYAFARLVGTGPVAAAAAATTYSLSGYFSLYSNNGFVRTYVYLPILCLLIEWVLRTRRLLPIALLGVSVAACVAVGMPEIAFFVLLTALGYALYRTMTGPRVRSRRSSLGVLAAGFGLGIALSAPLIGIFLEYERLSYNIHESGSGVGSLTDPSRNLLGWLIPYFTGPPLDPTWTVSTTRNWIGGAAYCCVLLAFASRTRAARLLLPFFSAATVVVLAKAYGAGALAWIGDLPIAERVNFPRFGLATAGFAAAVAVAVGCDAIVRREWSRSRAVISLVVGAAGAAVLLGANWAAMQELPDGELAQKLVVPAAAAVAAVGAAMALRGAVAAIALAAVVATELVLVAPQPFAERVDPFDPPRWISSLQDRLGDDSIDRVFGLDNLLHPNTSAAYGLHDPRMLDALHVERYHRYVRTFISPEIEQRFIGTVAGSTEGVAAVHDNPMFDLLGVRYIVARSVDALVSLEDFVEPERWTEQLDIRFIRVGGVSRPAIFQHTTNEVPLSLPAPFVGRIRFSYGVDDVMFDSPRADGVDFSIIATHTSGTREVLWSATYAPGDPADSMVPGWRSGSVDVAASDDPVIEISTRTDPRGNGDYDWSAWAGIVATDTRPGAATTSDFELRDAIDGTFIFENPRVAPRAFVAHEVTVARDVDAAEATFRSVSERFGNDALRVTGLDPLEHAVVEAEREQIPRVLQEGSACGLADASVEVVTYEPDRVVLDVETACPGLVVLSDVYFPGWRATIDGRHTEIYPTDLALRGVVVGTGRSTVVMTYRPASFRFGLIVALTAVVAALLVGARSIVIARRRKADTDQTRHIGEPTAEPPVG